MATQKEKKDLENIQSCCIFDEEQIKKNNIVIEHIKIVNRKKDEQCVMSYSQLLEENTKKKVGNSNEIYSVIFFLCVSVDFPRGISIFLCLLFTISIKTRFSFSCSAWKLWKMHENEWKICYQGIIFSLWNGFYAFFLFFVPHFVFIKQ